MSSEKVGYKSEIDLLTERSLSFIHRSIDNQRTIRLVNKQSRTMHRCSFILKPECFYNTNVSFKKTRSKPVLKFESENSIKFTFQ